MNKKLFTMLCLLLVTLLVGVQPTFGQCADNDPSSPVGIVPTKEPFPGGEPQCGGVRLTPGEGAQTIVFNLDGIVGNDVTVTITVGSCGEVMSWSVPDNIVIDKVFAKGSTDQMVYDYTSTNPRPSTDGNLHSPVNTGSGKYAAFSHIDFCFHYKLTIGKTAVPKFTRNYDWDIAKYCNGPSELTLSPGQIYNYPFSWKVWVFQKNDYDFKVEGSITITNNTPIAAEITSLTDVLSSGETGTVSCETSFPSTLAPGASLSCTYTVNLSGAVNGTNTATVETNTPLVEGGTALAPYAFGAPTTEVDKSIQVSDDCEAGTVTVTTNGQSGYEFTHDYSCPIVYSTCGQYSYTNTARFLAPESEENDWSSCSVPVNVPCEQGCTLTPGYWKTHSSYGPAPYDDTWAQLPNGAGTTFFLSGQSYYQVLWTAPVGNAYYILAHAYIAAQLNQLNGAFIPPAVLTAYNTATTLFGTKTPAQIAALRANSALRQQFISLATILDNYNNGITGPGHCSEETNGTSPSGAVNGPINEPMIEKPTGFTLDQNYPNPFNPVTQIRFAVDKPGYANLVVYTMLGEVVATLFDGAAEAGRYYDVEFDASKLSSGIYFYRLSSGNQVQVKKLILMR